jgi:5-formyltetrahydrofolate cyclo-ligase
MPEAPAEQKRALRRDLRSRRRERTDAERAALAENLTANIIATVTRLGAETVACYLSLPDEPDTRPFLDWAEVNGVGILLPVARDDGLLDWVVSGGGEVIGRHRMPEPVGETLGPIALCDADLVIVPASAVDIAGMRMGWGLGYFDKSLRSVKLRGPVYALIFDDELLEHVPSEVHDQAVGGVITPTRILDLPRRSTATSPHPIIRG